MADNKTKIIDKNLDKYLPKKSKLARAMRYSIFAGGKRFRPLLCLATAKALGKKSNGIIPIACAIEMIHVFTLIHDDLPEMDDSDYRRGKLTCHKKFDQATAVLAGDALNTLAFEVLAEEIKNSQVIKEVAVALLAVVNGQVLDVDSEGKKITLPQLKNIHKLKTGALIEACVRAPALFFKTSPKKLKALTKYAQHLGLAFQIVDDILDATSTQKELGKPVKADSNKGFPYFLGLDKSIKLAGLERQKALAALKVFGPQADELRRIAEFVVEREK